MKQIMQEQEMLMKKRRDDIETDPSIGRSEKELDNYLKKRGVKIDQLDH